MSSPRLAQRYAKSLMDLSVQMNQLEPVYNDMLFLQKILQSSREFIVMLRSPVIHGDKKIKIIEAVTQGNISKITDAFIKLLCKKGREDHLPEIIKSFVDQYNQFKGIHSATLTTAMPVSGELLREFETRIKNTTKVEYLNLESKVNDSLIGGFVLEMEGNLIDASILRNLKDVKKQFADNEYMHKLR